MQCVKLFARSVLATLVATAATLLLYGCEEADQATAPEQSTPPRMATASSAATLGEWSAPFSTPPEVAVNLILLPSGKVLFWGQESTPYVWDPATGTFTERPVGVNLFCAGHSFLADGRLLVAGGHIHNGHGLPVTHTFDHVSETWTRVEDMALGRWYPNNTTLANGEVLVVSGNDENGTRNTRPEVYKIGGGWRTLTSAPKKQPLYPHGFLAPNGKVFFAGPDPMTRYLSTSSTGAWSDVGKSRFGYRGYGSSVMYEPGKVLIVGGGDPPTATAEVINLNATTRAWQYTGSMAYARRHLNATLLPDGTVLATGGSSGGGFNNLAASVHAAELWRPATGRWTTLASNAVNRGYHSTTLLLPDARVLHTGSGAEGVPMEYSMEIFSPPYLFNADGTPATRPTITDVPAAVGYGQTFFVATPDTTSIARVTWIGLGAVTHAFDQNQRFVRLSFSQATGGLTVKAPAYRNNAPPGHYMLFLLNTSGVPSVARIIRLG